MRTTLSIDDDVLAAVKARARHEGRTAGEVVSEIVRREFVRSTPLSDRSRNGFPLLAGRRQPVADALVDQLREEEGL